jgi:hypothetical protein
MEANQIFYYSDILRSMGWKILSIFLVIEFVADKAILITVEQKYIDMIPANLRYNFSPTPPGGNCLGVKRSAETKAAISEALKGTIRSAETKAALSEAMEGNTNRVGSTHSDAAKAAISKAHGGGAVYVYDSNNVLVQEYAAHLYCRCRIFRG